ncbi:MAG TPA: hypothetical protein VMS77_03745 [Conexivisphaerales archaeon]|nr:hypothetical protein [Conexivisphaerales archaeon]
MEWAVDEGSLLGEAMREGETYRLMGRKGGVQVGVGARRTERGGELFVELTVRLCGDGTRPGTKELESSVMLLKELESRGYSAQCSEGTFVCELPLRHGGLASEVAWALSAIEKHPGPVG